MASTSPTRKVAEALAYDIWRYEKPNEEAVASALDHITRTRQAAAAAGFHLTFVKGKE